MNTRMYFLRLIALMCCFTLNYAYAQKSSNDHWLKNLGTFTSTDAVFPVGSEIKKMKTEKREFYKWVCTTTAINPVDGYPYCTKWVEVLDFTQLTIHFAVIEQGSAVEKHIGKIKYSDEGNVLSSENLESVTQDSFTFTTYWHDRYGGQIKKTQTIFIEDEKVYCNEKNYDEIGVNVIYERRQLLSQTIP